jgi:hypothetical protein
MKQVDEKSRYTRIALLEFAALLSLVLLACVVTSIQVRHEIFDYKYCNNNIFYFIPYIRKNWETFCGRPVASFVMAIYYCATLGVLGFSQYLFLKGSKKLRSFWPARYKYGIYAMTAFLLIDWLFAAKSSNMNAANLHNGGIFFFLVFCALMPIIQITNARLYYSRP